MSPSPDRPVLLFGYDSYITVPSMLPRPVLTETFGLTYRKIPVLAIGSDIYCDTSLIIEALEHFFPAQKGWGTIYPSIKDWDYRSLARGFASFWIDRPFFRITTGLIPPSVWRSEFGKDRGQLIGHTLDPEKLAAKVPANLSALDTHLSLLEPMLVSGTWLLPTGKPSLADVALYYQLRWGIDIATGKGVYNLTGGDVNEGGEGSAEKVFNRERCPGVWAWLERFEEYVSGLPDLEKKIETGDTTWKKHMRGLKEREGLGLVPAGADANLGLDKQRGLVPWAVVSVAPDDTGRDNPTVGRLVKIGVEEVIIKPLEKCEIDVEVHFPKVGFVVRTVDGSKL
ncbi:hypothetical protein N0V90_000404 [Kalmusia sp. IMI 367209]|nr:hypothetical protein N0V90_000404 [Kalmusia sp. IMI 367209]